MIRRAAATALIAATSASASLAAAPAGHICWVDRIVAEGRGVRIFLERTAPVQPADRSVHLEPGASIHPATSGHDGCTVTALRRRGRPGVLAQAHFLAPGIMDRPELRREWIPAARAGGAR